MNRPALELAWIAGRFAICRLAPASPQPDWARGALASVTRTGDELSVVCDLAAVPEGVAAEGPYAAFRVAGSLPLGLTGILASLLAPLAAASVPIFALSTFDTDYVLVRDADRGRAAAALVAAGHRFVESAASA